MSDVSLRKVVVANPPVGRCAQMPMTGRVRGAGQGTRCSRRVPVHERLAGRIENADTHGLHVEIDSAAAERQLVGPRETPQGRSGPGRPAGWAATSRHDSFFPKFVSQL
jgi:hypothetical protein